MGSMRFSIPIALLFAGCACLQAQFSNDYRDSQMYQRWDSSTKKAMAAINAGAEGKKTKVDKSLANPLGNKMYGSDEGAKFNKKSDAGTFRYDQKPGPGSYKMVRNFFGIKNPWIGSKTYVADKANLPSNNVITNADRKFTDKKAQAGEFTPADRKVAGQEDKKIKTDIQFVARGDSQGAITQANERLGKEMTIDQVRDLLNKSRKSTSAGSL